jgi:hypothetical protein
VAVALGAAAPTQRARRQAAQVHKALALGDLVDTGLPQGAEAAAAGEQVARRGTGRLLPTLPVSRPVLRMNTLAKTGTR